MRKFQVAPFDQHLTTCDGRDLNDNQATLAALRIYPGTTILLQVNVQQQQSRTRIESILYFVPRLLTDNIK